MINLNIAVRYLFPPKGEKVSADFGGVMTKTFKTGLILFISVCLFMVVRIAFSFVNLADNYLEWSFSLITQIIILGIIPLSLYKRWVNPEPGSIRKDLKIKFRLHPLTYPISVGLGIVFTLLTTYVSVIVAAVLIAVGFRFPASVGTIFSDNTVLIMSIICTALLPGIFEEIFNRGLFLKAMENVKNEKVLIVFGALFFGLFHQYAAQFWYALFGGAVLTIVTLRSKSVVPAMIMHFINNFFSVMMSYTAQKMPAVYDTYINLLLPGGVMLAPIIFLFLLYVLSMGIRAIKRLNSEEEAQPAPYGAPLQLKEKTRWWEYGFIYASFIATLITTAATFLWNFNG